MVDDEFYEDDEPIEDLRSAWNAGEKGTTSGPRDLNQRAKSIVDRAVARFEEAEPRSESGISPVWDAGSVVVRRATFGGHGVTAFVVSSSAETTNYVPG